MSFSNYFTGNTITLNLLTPDNDYSNNKSDDQSVLLPVNTQLSASLTYIALASMNKIDTSIDK
jgi:hypothetical protein